jgi:hypothetical protein
VTVFSVARTRWQYTADNGKLYSFNALAGYVAQVAVLGGEEAAAGVGPMTRGMKPRRALCWEAADHTKRRQVVCYEPTATAFTTLGTTVNVNIEGNNYAYVVYAMEGETHKFLGSLEP